MYPSIALAKVFLSEEQIQLIDQIIQEVAIQSLSSGRNESLSLWRDDEAFGAYLLLASSLEEQANHSAWDRMEEIVGSEERLTAAFGGIDLHTMLPHRIHGLQSRKTDSGQLVSLSTRRAEPGRSEDLMDEMEGIFESLRYINGYLGAALGPNLALPEEVIGMVFWDSRDAYQDSNPKRGLYEIRLYERVL